MCGYSAQVLDLHDEMECCLKASIVAATRYIMYTTKTTLHSVFHMKHLYTVEHKIQLYTEYILCEAGNVDTCLHGHEACFHAVSNRYHEHGGMCR